MAVGDVDQHIYAFRSSFNDFFDELIRLDSPDVLSLDTNYRSSENIVALSEAFISPQRKETSQKHMKSSRFKKCNNPNFLIKNDDSASEAENVYQIIKYLKKNNKIRTYSDVAILYRKHSDKTIANLRALFDADDEIDYSIRGQSDLADQNEVRSLILMLWYVARKTDFGYIPSSDELKEMNLKAFCGEYFEPVLWSLEDSTKSYLSELQDSFYNEVIRIENDFRKNAGQGRVSAVGRIKKNENQDTLIEIFKKVRMPEINLNEIDDEEDRSFFESLNEIREEVNSPEPPTVLDVFYRLLSLGNIFEDVESNYNEISNLALLTQTLYNYESFVSKTDLRGAFYFLKNMVSEYESHQEEKPDGVQMMTIHAAKGLEFPVTIITSLENGNFPMAVKDPKREKDYIFPANTYYSPNDCLEYKKILKEENGKLVHKSISIEEENELEIQEEDRVLYVAMTRAADLLILSAVGNPPEQLARIEEHLTDFSYDELANVEIIEHYDSSQNEKLKLNYSSFSTYNLCPFMYDLIYNHGFRLSSEDVTNLGTVFHEVMEKVNLQLMENRKPSKDQLKDITRDVYSSMFDIESTSDEFEKLERNILNYYETYSRDLDVLESELPFEIERENYILNGAIDLIYRLGGDEIAILDYKNAEHDDYKIAHYEKQLYIYASALMELSDFNKFTIRQGITHFVKTDYRNEVEITHDAVLKQLEKLNEVALKITDEKAFPKNRSNFCDSCKFKIICTNS
nr:ATP-dependent DNA helicase [uncultured Methanobrevibacter sp.]